MRPERAAHQALLQSATAETPFFPGLSPWDNRASDRFALKGRLIEALFQSASADMPSVPGLRPGLI